MQMLTLELSKLFKMKIPSLRPKSMALELKEDQANLFQAINFKSNLSMTVFTSCNKKNQTLKLNYST